jgi:hypothetical protein
MELVPSRTLTAADARCCATTAASRRTPSSAPPRARRDRSPSSPGDRDRRPGSPRPPHPPADLGRPGFPPTVHLPPPTDFHARRFSPRPTAGCSPVQRADPPGRRRRVRDAGPVVRIRPGGGPQAPPVSERDVSVPGYLTGPALASGARRTSRGTERSRGPVRRPAARGPRGWTTSPGAWARRERSTSHHHLPPTGGRPRKPPGAPAPARSTRRRAAIPRPECWAQRVCPARPRGRTPS